MQCDKYKIIFVHIPKTGGTSIEHAFSDDTFSNFSNLTTHPKLKLQQKWNDQECKGKHWDINKYNQELDKDTFNTYFKFSIIRNPWERLYSLFTFRTRFNPVFQKLTKEEKCLEFNKHIQLFKGHFKNQFDWLSIDNRLAVDEVYRFENLQEDFDKVCDRIGKDKIKLPHFYNSKAQYNYTEVYNDESRELIGELLLRDIRKFNYKFGD